MPDHPHIEAIRLTHANHKKLAQKMLSNSELLTVIFDVPKENYGKMYVAQNCNLHDV